MNPVLVNDAGDADQCLYRTIVTRRCVVVWTTEMDVIKNCCARTITIRISHMLTSYKYSKPFKICRNPGSSPRTKDVGTVHDT